MRWTRFTATLVIMSMLASCATYTPVAIRTSESGVAQLSQTIVPGDRVQLVMKSGERSEFRVLIVEQTRISSETNTYEFSEIESMEMTRARDERTAMIALVAIGVIALTVALLNRDERYQVHFRLLGPSGRGMVEPGEKARGSRHRAS